MKNVVEFFKKPKNVYFCIIGLITAISGLMSVSFSYYIPDSSDAEVNFEVASVNNIIQSADLINNSITLEPYEEKVININVISLNTFDSNFKLSIDNELVLASSNDGDNIVYPVIRSNDVLNYSIKLVNTSEYAQIVKVIINNGYNLDNIIVDGYELK